MSIQSHIMCKPVLQKRMSSLQLNFMTFVGPFHLNYSLLFCSILVTHFTPMPCCSFHMLLSHRQPRSGALLQLCLGFVLLKGRYCCLLRVQHLYVSLSGVYRDDVQDTDKFHFPSMFSSLLDKQAGSHLPLRLEVVSFVLPCVGARRLVQRALGTPRCLLPPSISLPGRGTKRRHSRS